MNISSSVLVSVMFAVSAAAAYGILVRRRRPQAQAQGALAVPAGTPGRIPNRIRRGRGRRLPGAGSGSGAGRRRRDDRGASALEWAVISAILVTAAVVIGGVIYNVVSDKSEQIQSCGSLGADAENCTEP